MSHSSYAASGHPADDQTLRAAGSPVSPSSPDHRYRNERFHADPKIPYALPYGSSTALSSSTSYPDLSNVELEAQPSDSTTDMSSPNPATAVSATPMILRDEVTRVPWYAPPQSQSRAQSLLRAFTLQRGTSVSGAQAQDVDSGLRSYSETTLPPPYTAG